MWYFGSSRRPANIRVRFSAARTSAARSLLRSPAAAASRSTWRLGLPCRLAELPVRRLAGVVQPQVVGQDAEDVGRIVGPAGHAHVDFRHRPVPVAAQEAGEPGLHDGGKLAGPVAADQLRLACAVEPCAVEHCAVEQRCRCGVGPDGRGELPEGQVHFGGHVVGKSPQDRLQGPRAGAASQQPAGGRQQGKAQGRQRQDVGYHREELVPQDALHVVQPLHRGGSGRHHQGGPEPFAEPLRPAQRRLGPEQGAEQRLRNPEPHRHRGRRAAAPARVT